MRTHDLRRLLTAALCASAFSSAPAFSGTNAVASDGAAPRRQRVSAPGTRMPLVFVENRGQFDGESAFQVRLPRLTMRVRNDGWDLSGQLSFGMRFDLDGPPAIVEGRRALAATASYLRSGAGTGASLSGVPTYERVRVQGLKPGLDLELFAKAGQLEYDILLSPGTPVSEVAFSLMGVDSSMLNVTGELIACVGGKEIVQRHPVSYQTEADGTRRPLKSRFVPLGANRYGFELEGRDLACPVVIDPVLVYNEFVGGSNADMAEDIAIDSLGDMYVAGWSKSPDFPGGRTNGKAKVRGRDAVVFKLSSDGKELRYVTFVGGSADEEAHALTVDELGQVTVVGMTKSNDFPVTDEAVGHSRAGNMDAFAFQLDASGRKLNWSTYLGGSADDVAHGIQLSDADSVLIVGTTRSDDFPTSSFGYQTEHAGGRDGFLMRLDATGRILIYSTLLGGSRDDEIYAVDVDSMGNAYLIGETDSPDFPVSEAAFDMRKSGRDAFVTKLGSAGTSLVYSSFLGGDGTDVGRAIALDSLDRVWVAGSTTGTGFPVTDDAMQSVAGGAGDGFVARLSISGSKLEYASFLGGSSEDHVLDLAIDVFDSPWFTGSTRSADFATTSEAAMSEHSGGSDGFLTTLDGVSGQLNFSTFVGMEGDEEGRAIAVQPDTESVVVVGFGDDISPEHRGPRSGSSRGPMDALVVRFEAGLCSEEAQLVDLGGGAGLDLSLTRPRLGSPFELRVTGAPPLADGFLFYSATGTQPEDLEGLAVLHLDRTRMTLVSRFVTDSKGEWQLTGRFSNRADFCGTALNLQVFTMARRFGPLSFGQASQGLKITFGY